MDTERRRHFDLFRRALDTAGDYPGGHAGRGIVTCGSLKFTPYLWILIRSLRDRGCSLPIELWHMAGEVNAPLREWFEPYGVTFRDGGRQPWQRHRFFNDAHGFKAYAVLHSAFREVLFLDADNSACVDPTFLFDTPEFVHQGAVFWSDPVPQTSDLGADRLRSDFGVAPGGDEFETGQFLIDKARSWPALALTLHLNEHSRYYYRFLFGDKETFRLAFDAARQPYLLVRQPADAAPRDWRRWGHCQYWTDGRPLFQHRAGSKWEMLVTRPENHDLSHLPAATATELFVELRRRWPQVMPVRERLRPLVGVVRRLVLPQWVRRHVHRIRSRVRGLSP